MRMTWGTLPGLMRVFITGASGFIGYLEARPWLPEART
jgi:hypothetical protein